MPELIFAQLAREPVAGQVKTRLLPALSAQQAMFLHSAMVEKMARTLCDCGLGEVRLWVDGDENHPLFARCRRLGCRPSCRNPRVISVCAWRQYANSVWRKLPA